MNLENSKEKNRHFTGKHLLLFRRISSSSKGVAPQRTTLTVYPMTSGLSIALLRKRKKYGGICFPVRFLTLLIEFPLNLKRKSYCKIFLGVKPMVSKTNTKGESIYA